MGLNRQARRYETKKRKAIVGKIRRVEHRLVESGMDADEDKANYWYCVAKSLNKSELHYVLNSKEVELMNIKELKDSCATLMLELAMRSN